jgi:ATP-dependent Clp protease ATP-binding subunit ClpC
MYRFSGFTEKANVVLNLAIKIAEKLGHSYVGSEHILFGLLKEGSGVAFSVFSSLGINYDDIFNLLRKEIGVGQATILNPDDFTPRTKKILQIAIMKSKSMGHSYVGTEHLLLAILEEKESYAVKFLSDLGISVTSIFEKINENVQDMEAFSEDEMESLDGGLSKGSALEKYGKDLTKLAKEGKIDPVIGRDKEIERVIQILSRRTKNNPCLIGEPGVGKTAIAEGLALKIVERKIPEILKNKRVISLDLTSMVAGTKYRGEFEERINRVLKELKKDENVILFVDEVHSLVNAGAAEGSVDAANILKPSLSRGEIQLIGATTIKEYRKYIEKDSALERRFQIVQVDEPTVEETILILKGLRDKYEAHHKVKILDDAIVSAAELSNKYIKDRFLPDKAIDLIDEACSKVRLGASVAPKNLKELEEELQKLSSEKAAAVNSQDFENAAKIRDRENLVKTKLEEEKKKWKQGTTELAGEIGSEDVAEVVAQWTGIPVVRITESENEKLLKLEDELKKCVIGQDEAVKAVSNAIKRGRVGLSDERRPIGSFIFLGPTGVGKTELCKSLAQLLFGSSQAIIKVDMSEYMEKQSSAKLIGSPPGYVGYDEGGQLTEKVRRRPYSVILFDEIEKAHPDVFNIFLQVLEDGVLTDSQGRKVNFKNTVIVMTSNIGAKLITEDKSALGFASYTEETSGKKIKETVMAEVKNVFKPEFLNRVDEIIVFNKLTEENVKKITLKLLDELKVRVRKLGIDINFTNKAVANIAKEGCSKAYGARPLRRVIRKNIEDEISEKIISKEIKAEDALNVDYDEENKKYVFNKLT